MNGRLHIATPAFCLCLVVVTVSSRALTLWFYTALGWVINVNPTRERKDVPGSATRDQIVSSATLC